MLCVQFDVFPREQKRQRKLDLATLLGLIGALGVLVAAVITGGSAELFINIPSLLIVFMGSLLVVLMKFNLKQFLGALSVAGRAFSSKLDAAEDLIPQIIEMNTVAQRQGVLALEDMDVENEFLRRGIDLLIDGNKPESIKTMLERDMSETSKRHTWGAKVFTALGDVAPAMGMIGTLIGLVQMLASMDDPKKIGPAMAIALLTTLYGAVLGNVIALPIADKLTLRRTEEAKLSAICIDGVTGIGEGQNPRVLESLLKTYLSPKNRNLSEAAGGDNVEELKQAA